MNRSKARIPHSKIAVVGGGIAGISAALLLSSAHEVTLFEASDSLGGHAHAEKLVNENGDEFSIDTAFLIFNDRTYPCFMQMLRHLGVEDCAIPAEMSSCFSDHLNGLHYSLGQGVYPVFKRPWDYLRPGIARIALDFLRFRKKALNDLRKGHDLSNQSARQYLSGFSNEFFESFVLPLTSAIWSLPTDKMEEFPILPLLRYFDNHRLLEGKSERRWKTFFGSSSVYVNAAKARLSGRYQLKARIQAVRRLKDGVALVSPSGTEVFDQVVIATHADTALSLLESPNSTEASLLGAWHYQDNPVTLHRDPSVLHADPVLWSSWNMTREKSRNYRVSYYLNRLQKLPSKRPVILTLGNCESIDPGAVYRRFNYRHPIFDSKALALQGALSSLNGLDRIYYTGSYFGNGFHEDAVHASMKVAQAFTLDWTTPVELDQGV